MLHFSNGENLVGINFASHFRLILRENDSTLAKKKKGRVTGVGLVVYFLVFRKAENCFTYYWNLLLNLKCRLIFLLKGIARIFEA